ncbi:MAG: rhomboid family intramembrane serine protease [Candidatus Aenigmarchaeota archaeon]|nr:rhomboid family intramembrane serine protease [Candidatus Aenigmarchaeota archaeon]
MIKNKKGQFFPFADSAPRKSFPVLTILLLILNVSIFVWSLASPEVPYVIEGEPVLIPEVYLKYGFIPSRFSLFSFSSIATIFTSMFLHGGLDHIFGNMWYLWIFGDNVEDKLGKIKFLLLYFLSGIAATFLHYLTNLNSEVPAIGASGAISGILGSYFVLFPRERVLTRFGYAFVRIPAFIVIGFWFFIQFLFGTISFLGGIGSGIAFFAHVGGFIFGFAFTFLLRKMEKI